MEYKPASKIEQALKLEYDPVKEDIWLTNQNTLRTLVGILGIGLPILLFAVLYIDTGHTSPLYSISHYYFTRASSVFIIVVSLMAIFLLVYKGKEPVDFYLSAVAGIFALLLVLFPTGNITAHCQDPNYVYCVTILKNSRLREVFHYISSAIFLGCLAYMSLFLFTKSSKTRAMQTSQKRIRNKIYIICGIMMLLAILVILALPLKIIPEKIFVDNHLVFWMETVAIESFGLSWLVKGEVILADRGK